MQRTIQVWAVSVAVVLLAAMTAQAAPVTIFSNFNSSTTNLYSGGSWWPVPSVAGSQSSFAMAFTPSGTYVLTQIDVALGLSSGLSLVDLGLYSDSGGAPGSLLASWTVTSFPAFQSCCSVSTLIPVASVALDAGTQYWLSASAGSGTTAAWMWNNIGQTGPVWGTPFPSAFTAPQGAFDVLGTTPEPASALFMTCGVALLGLVVKRRQRRA